MEAILKYNLNDENDSISFGDAQKGSARGSILWNLDEWLREKIKYAGKECLQEARDKLSELCSDEGIDIYSE